MIRFRGAILVEHEGKRAAATAWTPSSGRATLLKNVRVTDDAFPLPAVVVVHDKCQEGSVTKPNNFPDMHDGEFAVACAEAQTGIVLSTAGVRATLIAPRVILTAAHCVEGYSSWTVEVPAAAGGAREQLTTESLLWDWGQRACGDHCLDIALLFLPSPVTIERYPELPTQSVAAGTKAVAVGRIDDGQYLASATRVSRPTVLQVDGERYASSGLFLEKGDSGGPLFRAGTHELIGVSSAISRAQDFNVFQRFDTEVPSILQQVEAHGGRGTNASGGTCRSARGDHAVGDSFVAPDDCNSCTCRAGQRSERTIACSSKGRTRSKRPGSASRPEGSFAISLATHLFDELRVSSFTAERHGCQQRRLEAEKAPLVGSDERRIAT